MTAANDNGLPRFKVIEIYAEVEGEQRTDFLIADEDASEALILLGQQEIYCQVANRLTADMFVNALNFMPAMVVTLRTAFAMDPAAGMALLRKTCPDIAAQADKPLN